MLQTVSKCRSVLCLVSCLNIVLLLSYSVSWPPVWNKHLLIDFDETWTIELPLEGYPKQNLILSRRRGWSGRRDQKRKTKKPYSGKLLGGKLGIHPACHCKVSLSSFFVFFVTRTGRFRRSIRHTTSSQASMCLLTPKIQKGTWIGISSQTRKLLELIHYRNYCTESNHIFHSDKDHQMIFVSGPQSDCRHFEKKSKNGHIYATV